jgi:ParB-like chromosome segregation protein Spo0J
MSNIFPDYKVLPVDILIPYARNSRTHSPEQVAQIAASIKEFGFTNPVLVDESGGIIAGHGRVLAAQKLSMKEVPCIELSHLNEVQKRAYVIADNKIALNAGWDVDMLKIEFMELEDAGFDLELTGFSEDELKAFEGFTNEDHLNEKEQVDLNSVYEVVVECSGESEQEKVYNELIAKGYKCRVLTM